MSCLSRIAWYVALAMALSLGTSRVALAQVTKGPSLHVVAVDSDDADEQADALTTALRAHVRATPGWTLLDTTQSLSMMTAAFHCTQRPDAACLDRIGDTLKTDQFMWGVLNKGAAHQVNAEIHLWSRGKPDQVARASYSDNLKDANDDSLKKVATEVFTKLYGGASGTVVIHASTDTGVVLVDGEQRGTLDHGRATLSLLVGSHAIEVQAPGFAPAHQSVSVAAAGTSALEIVLKPEGSAAPEGPSKPLPIRPIIAWSAIAAGTVLVVTGVVLGVNYLGDQSDLNSSRQNNYGLPPPAVANPCTLGGGFSATPQTEKGCDALNAAHSAEVGEIVTLALGGVLAGGGLYLLLTDHPATPAPAAPAKTGFRSLRFLPSFVPGNGSLSVVGRF